MSTRKSTGDLSMYNVSTPPRAGWTDSTQMLRNSCQPSATAAHTARSSLAQPIPIVPSMPSRRKRLLHQGCDQKLSVGSRAVLRLVPIVLILQALLACLSRLISIVASHAETVPPCWILRRACVNPSTAFVWVGSLTTTNLRSSCLA